MNTTKPGVLRKAAMCEKCREYMPVGTEFVWRDRAGWRRDGAGRTHDRVSNVPAHAFDCVTAQIERNKAAEAADLAAFLRGEA